MNVTVLLSTIQLLELLRNFLQVLIGNRNGKELTEEVPQGPKEKFVTDFFDDLPCDAFSDFPPPFHKIRRSTLLGSTF